MWLVRSAPVSGAAPSDLPRAPESSSTPLLAGLAAPETGVSGGWFSPLTPVARCLALPATFWHRRGMRRSRKREFSVVVHRDEEGFYVASVPELRGCHTQARSLDKLMERIREAIELCLEVEGTLPSNEEFIGVQRVAV